MIFCGHQTWFVWCFLMSNITNTLNIDLLFFIDNIRVERFQFSKAKTQDNYFYKYMIHVIINEFQGRLYYDLLLG